MQAPLLVVHVQVHVLPEFVASFLAATLENAGHSLQERGIARFDVAQDRDDPTRFVLVEVYRSDDAPSAHKATAHYARWRDTVESMMAEPRVSRKLSACFPERDAW